MHRVLNERSYGLIEVNMRKTLQASAFGFIVLNLVGKALSHFLLIMVDYVKSALRNKQQITSNTEHGNTKKSIFSFTIANLVNKGILYFLYYKRVTRGGEGEVCLAPS